MHPIDTLKTRMQASAGAGGSARSALSFRSLFSPEMARVLGRGFVASVMGAGPQGGLRLSSYEYAKSHLLAHHHRSPTASSPSYSANLGPMAASAVAAVIGDLASSIVKVPREVVTARLQTAKVAAGEKPMSSMQMVSSIVRQQGPLGLFRGFWSTTTRDAPFMVILFTTYEAFKQYQHHFVFGIPTDDEDDDPLTITTLKSTLFGGVSGALAGFLTTPFDVIKTKVMTSPVEVGAPGRAAAASMWSVARSLARSAAIPISPAKRLLGPSSAFFTGAAARSVWWFGICSIFFPIYERSKETMRAITLDL
ncbi:mitochondrial carrier domain-containing protein [Zopfochytrium polystomum]|nr:mitochondrial carrier domain-containing protein [Zopfochytrium polystomum]